MKSTRILFIGVFALVTGTMYAQKALCSCCTENHSAFDFWVGHWTVTDGSGTVVGTNHIQKLENDCVLQERWKGSSGSTGISTNFFNSQTGYWEQLWVDNQGTHLKLKGGRIGNQMILSSEAFTHTDGKVYRNRITWTHNTDGTVRQLWEMVGNDAPVIIIFDGLYRKEE
ncbi:hypothetical protein [Maribacter sp.]